MAYNFFTRNFEHMAISALCLRLINYNNRSDNNRNQYNNLTPLKVYDMSVVNSVKNHDGMLFLDLMERHDYLTLLVGTRGESRRFFLQDCTKPKERRERMFVYWALI